MSKYVVRSAIRVAVAGAVIGAGFGAIGLGGVVFGAMLFAVLGAIAGALAGPGWWYYVCTEIIDEFVGPDTYEACRWGELAALVVRRPASRNW